MATTTRCKDCRHERAARIFLFFKCHRFAKCHSPLVELSEEGGIDYSTGRAVAPEHYYCSTARRSERLCGPHASKFEPR